MQTFDLMKFFAKINELLLKNRRLIIRSKTSDVMTFAQINVKYYYDRKHQSLFMKSEDFVYIRLHKEYDISFIAMLDFKLNQ